MHDQQASEAIVLGFERAWQHGAPPTIGTLVESIGDCTQRKWLACELIAVDLEYRWLHAKHVGRLAPRSLEDYARDLPGGLLAELPAELIAEEFRARRRSGEEPSLEDYRRRFPLQAAELPALFAAVDREIALEGTANSTQTVRPLPVRLQPAVDPRATLRYEDYRLLRLLGAGHMGRVYRAQELSTGRTVAVKYLRKRLLEDRVVVDRFVRESETLRQLSHPGIVGVHGLGRTPFGGYFLSLEYLPGGDLAQQMKSGPLPIDQVARWIDQAGAALAYVHEQGILHCDLKPSNLLLDGQGTVRIADFGLACTLEEAGLYLKRLAGTAPFMAPEQAASSWGPLSPQSDVYGLGACCYALLTGHAPFEGGSLADVLSQVVSGGPVRPVRSWRPELPCALAEACEKALAKPPRQRFECVAEFRQAILDAMSAPVEMT